MNWKEKCYAALVKEGMFEDSWHRTRFKELLDCYAETPFFSKGLCKCIYLSAWDEEHFCIMLEMLTSMKFGQDENTDDMRMNGDVLAAEQTDDGYYIYQLSNAFLDDVPFELDPSVKISPEYMYIIERALKASTIIDSL